VGEIRLARLGAELDVAETKEERIRILTTLHETAKGQEDMQKDRHAAALISDFEVLQAKAVRLKAEIALTREKAR
jgi:hypothetical protein